MAGKGELEPGPPHKASYYVPNFDHTKTKLLSEPIQSNSIEVVRPHKKFGRAPFDLAISV